MKQNSTSPCVCKTNRSFIYLCKINKRFMYLCKINRRFIYLCKIDKSIIHLCKINTNFFTHNSSLYIKLKTRSKINNLQNNSLYNKILKN